MSRPTADTGGVRDPGRRWPRLNFDHLIIVVAIAIAVPFTMPLCGPSTVDVAITFENPTDHALEIEVASDPDSGWVWAGFVAARSTAVVEHVGDQGDIWLFRFVSQGEILDELRLTRRELDASRWHIAVLAGFEERVP